MQDRWEREYLNSMDGLHFSTETKERMVNTITSQIRSEKGGKKMKRFSAKKTAVLAAVCVMAFGVTAFAGGGISTLLGGSSADPQWTDYQDLPKAEAEAGIDINAPENFGNGFAFSEAVIIDEEGLDENGQFVDSWKSIGLEYRNGDEALLTMKAQAAHTMGSDPAENATEVREFDGTKLFYTQDEYLFIPDRSDASAEELQREQTDPHFYISETGEVRETKTNNAVSFVKGDVYYSIYTYENMDAEALFDMAEMLIAE